MYIFQSSGSLNSNPHMLIKSMIKIRNTKYKSQDQNNCKVRTHKMIEGSKDILRINHLLHLRVFHQFLQSIHC